MSSLRYKYARYIYNKIEKTYEYALRLKSLLQSQMILLSKEEIEMFTKELGYEEEKIEGK